MRNVWTKRLSGLGAVALASLVVIGPMASMAQAASTTTSTTLPKQKTISGTETDNNNCTSVLDLGSPGSPTPQDISITMSSSAFPQPHEGDQIQLTNTKITLSIPASLLQAGVAAGIITDGQVIPSVVHVTIKGNGTKEGTHTFVISSSVTVHVDGGVAEPLTASLNLPNTKWTPDSATKDVFFSEGAVSIVSTIDLSATLGVIATATFTCQPRTSATFLAIGATGVAATTTTIAAPTTTAAPTTAATSAVTVAPAATNTLPRTGSNTPVLLALAITCISMGLFALRMSGRGRRARALRS